MVNYEVIQYKIDSINEIRKYVNQSDSIASLTNQLLNDSLHNQLIDMIDEEGDEDYSLFNDMEMIYLFVHKKRDMNDKKNRGENTKKEYLRDVLLFYKQLIEQAELIELTLEGLEQYQLFKRLTARHLRKYQEWLKGAPLGKGKKPYSVSTLSRKIMIIRGFLNFLFESKYIEQPIHKKMLSSNVRSEDRPYKDLSSYEVTKILEGFKNHPIVYGVISVLATTGLRIQELCTARVCDLSFVDGDYWLLVKGKGDKRREVLIHSNVLKTIEQFRLRRRLSFKLDPSDQSPLLTTASGKAYDYKYLSNYITRKIQSLDYDFVKYRSSPITPHAFRHFWAIQSEENGVNLSQIQSGLGHSDVKTTMIYLKRKTLRKNHAAHAWKNSDIINNI
ncbi:tyrosine-type recombinase/integrase [Robertmurraya sp. GLU-23]